VPFDYEVMEFQALECLNWYLFLPLLRSKRIAINERQRETGEDVCMGVAGALLDKAAAFGPPRFLCCELDGVGA
jgi:hypothetical protein